MDNLIQSHPDYRHACRDKARDWCRSCRRRRDSARYLAFDHEGYMVKVRRDCTPCHNAFYKLPHVWLTDNLRNN